MLWLEFRRSCRELARRPGLTLLAGLSLALGIGINTAVFSLVDAVLLRPLAVPRPAELRQVTLRDAQQRPDVARWDEYLALRENVSGLRSLVGFARHGGFLSMPQGKVMVTLHGTSDNYFEALEVKPLLGQAYTSATPEPSGAVLGHSAWQRYFGGDPCILGREITLNGRALRVLAVMPDDFTGTQRGGDVAIWVSSAAWFQTLGWDAKSRYGDWDLMARVPASFANEALTAQAAAVLERRGERRTAAVYAAQEGGWLRTLAFGSIFFATVGLIIVIAGLNAANLGLVRNEARKREIAVRLALGAARKHLARQLLMDGFLLSLLAAGGGLLLAVWAIAALPALLLPGMSFAARLDWRVLTFTMVALGLSTLVVSLAPILDAWRRDVISVMRGDATPRRQLWRAGLAAVQVALCVSLAYTGVLLTRSMDRVMKARPGMDPDRNLLLTSVARRGGNVELLAQELSAVPGVRQVAWARRAHLAGSGGGATIKVSLPGQPEATHKFNLISPGYFATTGARLRQGRVFEERDTGTSTPVVIVNEKFAEHYFPGATAVGRWVRVREVDRQIVGVAENGPVIHVRENNEPYLYLPFAQITTGELTFLIQTEGDPGAVAAAVRQKVQAAGSGVELMEHRTWRDHLRQANSLDRSLALTANAVAALALLLAAGGLFAMLLFSVSRRTREFGIRLALGARRADVVRAVLRDGLRIAAWGIPAGLAGALAGARAMRGVLFGISSVDAISLALTVLAVLAVVLAATAWPARRASQVNPIEALRWE